MKVTLIGTGNVAWHLATALARSPVDLVEIVGRNDTEGRAMASATGVPFSRLGSGFAPTDLILVATADSALPEIFPLLPEGTAAAHTAGGVDIMARPGGPSGVFYPLQTFSRALPMNWADLPVLIEASDEQLTDALIDVADALGALPTLCTSADRLRLHCAAVLVNNMTNHLFAAAEELLGEKRLPFALLHPLMRETVRKAMALSPSEAQTGPAKRGDTATINRHLQLLAEHPQTAVLYAIISKHITRHHHG